MDMMEGGSPTRAALDTKIATAIELHKKAADPEANLRDLLEDHRIYRFNPSAEQYLEAYKVSIETLREIAEKRPSGLMAPNASDLLQLATGYLPGAIQGFVDQAESLSDIPLNELTDLVADLKAFLQEDAKRATGYIWPTQLRSAEIMSLRLLDLQEVESGANLVTEYKNRGTHLTEFISQEQSRTVPLLIKLSEDILDKVNSGEIEVQGIRLSSSTPDFKTALREVDIEDLHSALKDGKEAMLVVWEGGTTPPGITIAGQELAWMQHGKMTGTEGQLGYYDRLIKGGGKFARLQAAILYVEDVSSIKLDESVGPSEYSFLP